MEGEEEENNQCREQNILKITQVMEVALAVTTVQVKNDDHYVWISKKGVLFFEIYMSVKLDILFNVMDIVSQLKDKGIRIIVPFCMIKTVFYIYMYIYIYNHKICFNLFYCVLHCRYCVLHCRSQMH